MFTQTEEDVVQNPFVKSEFVIGALSTKVLQVEEAGEQGRALADNLMGAILCHSNIKQAYKQVKQNKGVAGIDRMPVGGDLAYGIQKMEKLYWASYKTAHITPKGKTS